MKVDRVYDSYPRHTRVVLTLVKQDDMQDAVVGYSIQYLYFYLTLPDPLNSVKFCQNYNSILYMPINLATKLIIYISRLPALLFPFSI